jgi:hypothetical protein
MRTRRLLLAAVAVTAAAVGVWTAADPNPQGPAAPGPASPIAETSVPPQAGHAVTWVAGPWGNLALAGHRLLLPGSGVDGPLVDQGDGWAVGYRPTPLGAAIAVLRQPLLVLAAPTRLHAVVDQACLTDAFRNAGLLGGTRNTTDRWALPRATVDTAAASDVRLLGVTAQVEDLRAEARVFQAIVGEDAGDLMTATDYVLLYGSDRQWRIHAVGSTTVVTGVPAQYTLPAPSEG